MGKWLMRKMETPLRWDAIMKEWWNVRPALENIKRSASIFYLISKWQACLVAKGSEMEAPPTLTYSSVGVCRDSVQIVLTIAALNLLKLLSCAIQNAYLTANCHKCI